jgi:Fe-S cluster assembly protein SufD
MRQMTQTETGWVKKGFDQLERSLNGGKNSDLHNLRTSALQKFTEIGFPTARNEEWRFTNISPIKNTDFAPVLSSPKTEMAMEAVARLSTSEEHGIRLVFLDGHFAPALSTFVPSRGPIVVENLATAIKRNPDIISRYLGPHGRPEDNPFSVLSLAFLQDGAFVQVADNTVADNPIECLYIVTDSTVAQFVSPRNLFLMGSNCKVSVLERYACLGEGLYLNSAVTEVVVGKNSVVFHDKVQTESSRAFHIGTTNIHQSHSSAYTNTSIALGGALVRNTVTATFEDEGCVCTLNGLALGTGTQLVDNHTVIDHAKPHCESHELYKSILADQARGVFNGKILVRKDAQKTDAKQTNKTLLLSDDATIDTKPQLEIFADDVKCTHGATVGQLDEEQLFYLRSRGIDEQMAKNILTFAFAADVVGRLQSVNLQEQLRDLIHERLDSQSFGNM